MMDFTLTETQQAVADLTAQVLAEPKPDPWKELAQAGLLALTVPENLGGDGLGVLETAVLLTEIGRSAPLLAAKALATLMTGVLPVARWGSPDLQRQLLPPVASGELLLTAALREPSDPAPENPATTVTGNTITGTKVGVLHAGQAARILVTARLAPAPSRLASASSRLASAPSSMVMASSGHIAPNTGHDHGVVIVDPTREGVRLMRAPSSSGQPEYTMRLDRAPIAGILGPAACARDLYQLAVAGACAAADGALAGALALTRDHVATRHQFGRPLAAFQAVSQQVADVYITSRTLRLATVSACWRLAEGRHAAHDLDVAGYWVAAEAPRAVRIAHHLHGGIGMDEGYPLHRYSSLVSDLVRFLGGAEYRLERQACSPT